MKIFLCKTQLLCRLQPHIWTSVFVIAFFCWREVHFFAGSTFKDILAYNGNLIKIFAAAKEVHQFLFYFSTQKHPIHLKIVKIESVDRNSFLHHSYHSLLLLTTNIVRYQIGPKNSSNDLKKVIRAKSNDPANKSINAIHWALLWAWAHEFLRIFPVSGGSKNCQFLAL